MSCEHGQSQKSDLAYQHCGWCNIAITTTTHDRGVAVVCHRVPNYRSREKSPTLPGSGICNFKAYSRLDLDISKGEVYGSMLRFEAMVWTSKSRSTVMCSGDCMLGPRKLAV